MRRTKRRLKKWVKISLAIVGFGLFLALAIKSNNNWEYWATKCDQQQGYTCNYYEVRQLMIKGEK